MRCKSGGGRSDVAVYVARRWVVRVEAVSSELTSSRGMALPSELAAWLLVGLSRGSPFGFFAVKYPKLDQAQQKLAVKF
ncbi:unnamed protein product [Caenorhabditis auriculariae]|uniref:Uncharacterized protein n=1 Tax=Caenorhabditis auriculariae TaxID=2777116 RepID=A0A8S1GUA6_9PELO|nr:unnamed protein product [Caenorhabditis auriculariae]